MPPHGGGVEQGQCPCRRLLQLPLPAAEESGRRAGGGAGTGNDVAGALRNGATTVTAVEIDPAVLYLGHRLHPERVYQDPRTRCEVNDARSFLRQTDKRFDTIVYGLLDSHTNLGAMTNVRLDSFVYTLEGFKEAVVRLKDDGLLVVSYLVLDPRQGHRLYAMLRDAYPAAKPRAFTGAFGNIFATGPGLAHVPATIPEATEQTAQFFNDARGVELATDDWPFFYMQERAYPFSYVIVIGLLLGLSLVLVKRHLGLPRLWNASTGTFFFLGAGFMLIETKAITELGLVFGNTWAVVAIAIGGILVMAFLANQFVLWCGPVPALPAFALLGLTLGLGLLATRLSMAGGAPARTEDHHDPRSPGSPVLRRVDLLQRTGSGRGNRRGSVGQPLRRHAGRFPGVQLDVPRFLQPLSAGHGPVRDGRPLPDAQPGEKAGGRRGNAVRSDATGSLTLRVPGLWTMWTKRGGGRSDGPSPVPRVELPPQRRR